MEKEFYSREMQILKQSQIKIALEYVTTIGVTLSVKELHFVTEIFIEMCLKPLDDDMKVKINKLDKWLMEKKQKQINE
jgi:hypothetical protein